MQDINFYDLIKFYAKKWLWIVSLTFVGLITGFVFSNFIQTPLYKSEATLLLVRSNNSAEATPQDTVLLNNYIELFKSRRVLEPVIEKQDLKITHEDMASLVEASNSKSTEVIKVAVSMNNAEKSKSFLEAAVVSFKDQVKQLYKLDNVKIVDSASLSPEPYNIQKGLTAGIYAAAGFVIAVIVLFFIYDYKIAADAKKQPNGTNKDGSPENTNPPVAPSLPIETKAPEISASAAPASLEPASNLTVPVISPRPRDRLSQASYMRERSTRR